MVNLLEKFSVRAGDAPIKLLKVIKNPVTDYLPPGCKKTLFSFKADQVVRPSVIAKKADNGPHCVSKSVFSFYKEPICTVEFLYLYRNFL